LGHDRLRGECIQPTSPLCRMPVFQRAVNPNETKELGWMQDWVWVPGEKLTLKKGGYRTVEYEILKRL